MNKNEIGQLLMNGPYVVNHYYNMDKMENAKRFDAKYNFLITGDIALFNESGQSPSLYGLMGNELLITQI